MVITKLLWAILQVYSWLILARVVISWIKPDPRHEIVWWIIRLTEPVLRPLRMLVPLPVIDLSPVLAWLLIRLLMNLVARM